MTWSLAWAVVLLLFGMAVIAGWLYETRRHLIELQRYLIETRSWVIDIRRELSGEPHAD